MPNTNNPDFINNNNKLFKLIETLQPSIEGESSLKYIDTTTDNRLNNFQSQMILRFNEGLKKGINVDELLNKTSKNYIGKGLIQIYKSDKDAITQIIAEKSAEVSGNKIEIPPYSEEKYGSVENYLNSQEYLDYKFPGRIKIRKNLQDTSDITQEEFDKGADQMIIDGNVLEISNNDGFPGIEYKGQFYAYDDEGNPPKRFLERLQKDRKNNKVKAGKINYNFDENDKFIDELWGKYYQGTNSKIKNDAAKERLNKKFNVPDDAINAINVVAPLFEGDGRFTLEEIKTYLTKIGQIESEYKRNTPENTTVQIGGGPARSYWQVEPFTANDLLKESSVIFGDKFNKHFKNKYSQKNGMSASEYLESLTLPKLSKLIEKDDELAAAFAAAKIVTTFNSKTS